MTSHDILTEAVKAIEERGSQYGHPSVNFERIARLMNAWLAEKLLEPLTVQDVAMLGICMKMGRLLEDPEHRDSVVDIAGYANAYWEAAADQRDDFCCDICGEPRCLTECERCRRMVVPIVDGSAAELCDDCERELGL